MPRLNGSTAAAASPLSSSAVPRAAQQMPSTVRSSGSAASAWAA